MTIMAKGLSDDDIARPRRLVFEPESHASRCRNRRQHALPLRIVLQQDRLAVRGRMRRPLPAAAELVHLAFCGDRQLAAPETPCGCR